LADAYNALHDEQLSLFPDAHETLDRLKEWGIKLALITNGAGRAPACQGRAFRPRTPFRHIQIEGEHGFGKPSKLLLERIAQFRVTAHLLSGMAFGR
jgi:putative hydrolase of the HAD superfamily